MVASPASGSMRIDVWSPTHVADFLQELGLEQYLPSFKENSVDGIVLCHLDQNSTKDLGITSVGQRLKLLRAVYDIKVSSGVPIDGDAWVPASERPSKLSSARTQQTPTTLSGSSVQTEIIQLRDTVAGLCGLVQTALQRLPQINTSFEPGSAASWSGQKSSGIYSQADFNSPASASPQTPHEIYSQYSSSNKASRRAHLRPSLKVHLSSLKTSGLKNSAGQTSAGSESISGFWQGGTPNTSRSIETPTTTTSTSLESSTHSFPPKLESSYHMHSSGTTTATTAPPSASISLSSASLAQQTTPYLAESPLPNPQTANAISLPSASSTGTINGNYSSNNIGSGSSTASSAKTDKNLAASSSTPSNARFLASARDDRCFKVLPAALRKYKLQGEWKDYVLILTYRGNKRVLAYNERPRQITKQLEASGEQPSCVIQHVNQLPPPIYATGNNVVSSEKTILPRVQSVEERDEDESLEDGDVGRRWGIAIADWVAGDPDEMSMNVGDFFVILSQKPGYYQIRPYRTASLKSGYAPKARILSLSLPPHRIGLASASASGQRIHFPIDPSFILTQFSSKEALLKHSSTHMGELDLNKGDKLRVYSVSNHWAYGIKDSTGERGWMPCWLIGNSISEPTTPMRQNSNSNRSEIMPS